ncbi:MAG: RNA methyltransferase [Defluviitaleaceae bacterium]|nr:RNA methyltransferase [Defluviitaleaceae bacterium]
MEIITSRQNNFIKRLISLDNKKYRDEYGEFIIEGENFVSANNEDILTYCFSESYYNKETWRKYVEGKEMVVVSDELFKKISDTVSPQGVLAIAKKKNAILTELVKKENPFFVVAENLSDPGNLGTIIRTADASGADGVILLKGCVDVYNKKVVRSSAGSIFNVPIVWDACTQETTEIFKVHNILMISSHLSGKIYPYDVDFKRGCAIIIGNEANGISKELAERTDCLVKLPMKGRAESLNVSIAAGIILYEVLRQRL